MIPKVVAIALVCAFLSALLEGLGFKSRKLFATLSLIVVMIGLISRAQPLFSSAKELADRTGVSDAASSALRAVGLGYVFGFTSDICSSLGEPTLATLVTTVGRLEIFMLAFPYFEKMIELGIELIG